MSRQLQLRGADLALGHTLRLARQFFEKLNSVFNFNKTNLCFQNLKGLEKTFIFAFERSRNSKSKVLKKRPISPIPEPPARGNFKELHQGASTRLVNESLILILESSSSYFSRFMRKNRPKIKDFEI